jgi:hypothetical protein
MNFVSILKKTGLIASFTMLVSFSASANTLLWNTGVTDSGKATQGSVDEHYTMNGGAAYTAIGVNSLWLSDSASSASAWITPTQNPNDGSLDPFSNGTYTYSQTFNLSGFDASKTSFSALWAADNNASVYLNGNLLASITGGGYSNFNSFSSFSASSGFVSGLNTLNFVVTNLAQNGGNPSGLRVEFSNVSVTPVPEPKTNAMLFSGLALMGLVVRRRKTLQA